MLSTSFGDDYINNTCSTAGLRCNLLRPAVLPWIVQMGSGVSFNY